MHDCKYYVSNVNIYIYTHTFGIKTLKKTGCPKLPHVFPKNLALGFTCISAFDGYPGWDVRLPRKLCVHHSPPRVAHPTTVRSCSLITFSR